MVSRSQKDELLNRLEGLVGAVGDKNANPGGDQQIYREQIKGILNEFLEEVIRRNEESPRISREIERLNTELNRLNQELTNVKSMAEALSKLGDQQQGTLGLILKANKARVDAQATKDEALKFVKMAESDAEKARIAAPDTLSTQAVLSRAEEARKTSDEAVTLANEAISVADLAIRKLEPSQSLGSVMDDRSPEELAQIAREKADKAITLKEKVQQIADEVTKLAHQTTQEYDNWAVIQTLFAISE